MKRLGLFVLVISCLKGQTTFSPCDVNHDGLINITDVQAAVNQALGVSACTSDLDGDGKCDIIDVQRVITAALGGTCNASAPSRIQLPIEMIGPDGTSKTASFNIPAGSSVSGATTLRMTIHGLRTETQASVQVNNSAWMPISSSTVTLLGQAAGFGGIGGGFHTLSMSMSLLAGTVTTGTNTISFKFNGTDGRVSGFRVLAFNILGSDSSTLLPTTAFVEEDPNTWLPPLTQASDIAAGKSLYYNAPLTVPTPTGPVSIQAHCTDCHAQDGRDLKYFNYSNNSIRTRSMFHGLTAQQGDQIASYIRSLNVPNPGRPWNPPYQPGPGLDAQPVTQWSAGAGLDAVLNSDQDVLNAMFPTGIPNSPTFSYTGKLNVRETAVALQLPDWNSWLPTVYPADGWGSAFVNSGAFQRYLNVRSLLVPGSVASYLNASGQLALWESDYQVFITPNEPAQTSPLWTPQYIQKIYSTPQWMMVKNWEINQEFGLEGMAQSVFLNPKADARAWFSQMAFLTSPNMLHIPKGLPGLDNGQVATWAYLAMIWYHVQLTLNNSNYAEIGTSPIDWPYVYAFIKELSLDDSPPQAALLHLWLIKGLQISNNGIGPDKTDGTGWAWLTTDLSREVSPGSESIWTGTAPATRTSLSEGMIQNWLAEVAHFTPQQFYAGGSASPTQTPTKHAPESSLFIDRVWYMIPQFHYFGVNQTLINQLADWAKTIWPLANWDLTKTATCTGTYPNVICSTEN